MNEEIKVLLIDYIHGKESPVPFLMSRLQEVNPGRPLTRETVRYWVQAAKAGEKVVIKLNRGKPYWLGREAMYWSAE